MKITIRAKLFLVFGTILSVLILLIVVLNTLFLDDFYLIKNENTMYSTFKSIDEAYQDSSIIEFINAIDRQEGISTLIINAEREILYNSYQKTKDAQGEKLPKEIEDFLSGHLFDINHRYAYGSTLKQEGEIPKVTFIARSRQGDLIILTKPMKGISDSVLIANQFTLMIGALTIILGSAFMSVLSKSLTKPIRSMNQVTREISELDFSHRVKVNSHDELGELGNNINTISVKLNDSVQSLRSDIERRKQLARDMSHELKTPISAIKGYAEGLTHGVADTPEKFGKYVGVIVSECDRMDMIVRHLLDLSRLEDASIRLKISDVDLKDLIDELAKLYEPYILENGFQLEMAVTGSIIVKGDREMLEKALGNLITNAVKYGGHDRRIKIRANLTVQSVEIVVFNSGDPIPESELPKLFNLFYKVDQARSRDEGGHGIGLAIVKQIAELHQGQVFARNTVNGVEFVLKLPA